jgi:hypothetical protein
MLFAREQKEKLLHLCASAKVTRIADRELKSEGEEIAC